MLGLKASPATVLVSQHVEASLTLPAKGYLYLFELGTQGKSLELLFPNDLDGFNLVDAGPLQIPRNGWALTARGPAGVGYLVAVLTLQEQDLKSLKSELRSKGRIKVQGPYLAAMTPVREIAP